MDYKVIKENAEAYIIRMKEPVHTWGVFTVRSFKDGGSIDIQSDYGDYCYTWVSIGSETFKQFLLSVDYGYFMGKCIGGHGERFSAEKTIEGIKRDIFELRREKSLFENQARELYDTLIDGDFDCDSQELFFERLFRTNIVSEIYSDDPHSISVERKPNYQAKAFWENLWPAFCEIIKEEENV